MQAFTFHNTENNLTKKICSSLHVLFGGNIPVIICVGTDLSIGDSLGPLVGTILCEKDVKAFVYGKLSGTITAKEVDSVRRFVEKTHPKSKTLVIDAAVGSKEDVGCIRISLAPLKPGSGASENLPEIGDVTIIGIVAQRSCANYSLLNLTRLSPIYKMAKSIACGIADYIDEVNKDHLMIASKII